MSKVNLTYQVVTDRIIARMEQGEIPWRKTWSAGSGLGACKNLVSGKPYQGINAFLTALAGYSSPYFLTFKQAKDLGGSVKAGAKGLPIVYFSMLETKEINPKTGKPGLFPMARYFTVFNLEQCEGIEAPTTEVIARPFSPIESAERIVSGSPMNVRVQHGGGKAYYSPTLDYIGMPPRDAFESPEAYYATLFHEMGHATGHESRLARDLSGLFGSHSYSREELVAEMTAAFLCADSGIESQEITDNAAAYLQGWIKVLKGDPKLVIQAASAAQKAANLILNRKAGEAGSSEESAA